MGHNGGVEQLAAVVSVLVQDSTEEGFGLQAGPYAFFFFVAMGLALVFLLFSLRKQIRRIRFNDQGESDAERMTGTPRAETPDGDQQRA
jgi:hypothetical protein